MKRLWLDNGGELAEIEASAQWQGGATGEARSKWDGWKGGKGEEMKAEQKEGVPERWSVK